MTDKNMNFGEAIAALKDGRSVARAGWNGKGMHLYIEDMLYRSMPRHDSKTGKVKYIDRGKYEPCIVMFTAQGKHAPGWLASQADMLAEDWLIVEHD